MTYKGLIKKSRTLDAAALLTIFGAVQQYLPYIQDKLAGNYGYVFGGVGVLVAYLRFVTTKPVGEK